MDNMGQLLTLCGGNPGLLSPSPHLICPSFPSVHISSVSLSFCLFLTELQFVQLRQIREERMREARRRGGEKRCEVEEGR